MALIRCKVQWFIWFKKFPMGSNGLIIFKGYDSHAPLETTRLVFTNLHKIFSTQIYTYSCDTLSVFWRRPLKLHMQKTLQVTKELTGYDKIFFITLSNSSFNQHILCSHVCYKDPVVSCSSLTEAFFRSLPLYCLESDTAKNLEQV